VRSLADEGLRWWRALAIDSLCEIERVAAIEVDLVEPGGSERLVGEAVDRHGRVDVLVKNVGGVRLRLGGLLQATTGRRRRRCSTSQGHFRRSSARKASASIASRWSGRG
jgi:NAD(P)-dependent dehydrogenase (short-subunit alcohol dehydrogenase family)